ncbi:hypothetical protein MAP00_004908 [Monascus purpureus]|nr:hypothetical protein MAP00_004908 [Monascus purpureus]
METNKRRTLDAGQSQVSLPKRSRINISRKPPSRDPLPVDGSNDAKSAASITSQNNLSEEEETSSLGEDETSSDSSSSESDGNDDADEDNGAESAETPIPYVPGRPKPRIYRVNQDSDILSRVSSFLPKLRSANEALQREIDAGRAKDVKLDEVDGDEEGQYIEMNLGLGVLEEKRDDNETDTSEEDATSDTDVKGEEEEAKDSAAAVSRPPRPRESNILGKLMGNKTARKNKPAIEEIVD